jgi:hypothetical protein
MPYNIKNALGRNYPVTKQGTTIRLQAGSYGVTPYDPKRIETIRFYEGMHQVGESKPNFYGVYTLNAAMNHAGTRWFSAQLEMTDGSMVTTRPALIHVHGDDTFVEHIGITPVSTTAMLDRLPRATRAYRRRADAAPVYSVAGRRVMGRNIAAALIAGNPDALLLPVEEGGVRSLR